MPLYPNELVTTDPLPLYPQAPALPVVPSLPALPPILPPTNSSVSILSWEEIRPMVSGQNTQISVFDILTGTTYQMIIFSAGNHADVIPASPEDTDRLFETFGHEWSWEVRPVWVTIGDLRVAASINGQPHGDVDHNHYEKNHLEGHVCLHFFGSTVHNGNLEFAQLHQDILIESFLLGQNLA